MATFEFITFWCHRFMLTIRHGDSRQVKSGPVRLGRPTTRWSLDWWIGAALGLSCSIAAVCCAVATARAEVPQAHPPDEPAPRPPFLHLDYFEADLQLQSRYERQRVSDRQRALLASRRSYHQRNTLLQFEETMGLRLGGDVIDPGFLSFDADVRLGLDQQRARERRDNRSLHDYNNGWLSQYDIRLDLFTNKPISGSFFVEQEDERVSRLFLPSLEHDRTRYGTSWQWLTEHATMRLSFERTRDKYLGQADEFDDENLRETALRYESEFQLGEHHDLHIDAEYARLREQYQGNFRDFAATRSWLGLYDVILFGAKQQHRLETNLYYQEEQGELGFDLLEVGPQLTLTHSDVMQTRYKYQFSRQTFDGITIATHRADFDLQHRLTEDLTTTLELYGQREFAEDSADLCNLGGSVHWNYRRPNPWGRLSAHLGYWYDYERIQPRNGTHIVLNESHRLRDPLPSYLNRPNVILSSLVVTSIDRQRVYQLGSDYTVIRRYDRTALVRLPLGWIDDGDSVLVRYLYTVRDGRTTQTHQIEARIQQDFEIGLTPYYAVTVREQNLDQSDPLGFEPNRLNRHRLGLTYRRQSWSAGAEFEYNDETIEPYTAGHFTADWAPLAGPIDQLDLTFSFSQFCFRHHVGRDATLLDVRLDYRHNFNTRTSLRTAAAYRFEHDTISGDTYGLDLESEFEYRIGQLTLSLAVEYDNLRIASSNEEGLAVWFKIRRDF